MDVRHTAWLLLLTTAVGMFPLSAADAEPPLSAEQAVILGKWRRAVAGLERYQVRGQRMIYNHVFEVETWSDVVVDYEAPQSVRLHILPSEISKGARSHRINHKTGEPYRLEADTPSIWEWTADELVIYGPGTGHRIGPVTTSGEDSEGSVELTEVPEVPQPPATPEAPLSPWQMLIGCAISIPIYLVLLCAMGDASQWNIKFPLLPTLIFPSLFLVDTPSFDDDFDCSISRRPDQTIRIDCVPKSQEYRDYFQCFSVILDPETGRPKAQRMVDPSENVETVIIFSEWDTTPASPLKIDRSQWDYEAFELPPEMAVLPHRQKKR